MSDFLRNNNDVSPRATLCKNNDQSLSETFRNNSSFSEVLQISAIAEEGVAMPQPPIFGDIRFVDKFWKRMNSVQKLDSKSLEKDCPMTISVILLFGSSQGNAQFCVLILDRNN